jgi:hypothetical protein
MLVLAILSLLELADSFCTQNPTNNTSGSRIALGVLSHGDYSALLTTVVATIITEVLGYAVTVTPGDDLIDVSALIDVRN